MNNLMSFLKDGFGLSLIALGFVFGLIVDAMRRIWTSSVPDFEQQQHEKADERFAASAHHELNICTWLMVAVALVAGAVLMAFSTPAGATTVGVHVATWHSEPGYNGRNPGLYVKTDSGLTFGAYRNSERANTVYAGQTWESDSAAGLRVAATAGLITGYRRAAVLPFVLPSVLIADTVRITYVPRCDPKSSEAVHLSIERKF